MAGVFAPSIFEGCFVIHLDFVEYGVEFAARFIRVAQHASVATTASKIPFHLVIAKLIDYQNKDVRMLGLFICQVLRQDRAETAVVIIALHVQENTVGLG